MPIKACPWQQGNDAKIQQGYGETMKFAAAAKRGQAVIATTSEQKNSTSGFSATQFGSTRPMGMAA